MTTRRIPTRFLLCSGTALCCALALIGAQPAWAVDDTSTEAESTAVMPASGGVEVPVVPAEPVALEPVSTESEINEPEATEPVIIEPATPQPEQAVEEAAPEPEGQEEASEEKNTVERPVVRAASGDTQFREALISTYASNPDLQAQRAQFEATGEAFNQALSGWLPTISAEYSKGRRRNRSAGSDWDYVDARERNLNMSQPLVDIGTYFSIGEADNSVRASGSQLISTTQNVLLDAISAYLDVVRDREILELSRHNVRVLGENLEATRDRFNVGEATRTDTSQSEARLSRAESDAIQAEGNLAISEAAFERIIGYRPAEELAYPAYVPPIPASLNETIEKSLKGNPSLIAARFSEDAAEDAADARIADLLPTAALEASASRTEGAGFTGIEFDSDTVQLSVNIPLYRAGADHSRVREAKSQRSSRRFEYLNTTNQVRERAISAWEQYQTALGAMDARRDTIRAAEVALDGVQQEQLYGSRTVLDVLDAEQELFVARVNLARTDRDRMVAMYNLLAVAGELSPSVLQLDTKEYDTDEAYGDVRYQFIGF